MAEVLILSFSLIASDPRVIRQVRALKPLYNVTVVGYGSYKEEGVSFIEIEKPTWTTKRKVFQRIGLLAKRFEWVYASLPQVKEACEKLPKEKIDVIIANDIESLPLLRKRYPLSKIIFDAHEYAPKEFASDFWWKFYFSEYKHYLCRRYLPMAERCMTVCKGLADKYEETFGVPFEVMMSLAKKERLKPSPVEEKIRIIHHGYPNPDRMLHLMIEAMDRVDERFHLDLMLIKTGTPYFDTLQKMVDKRENVSLIPPVSFEEIVPFTNRYDIGLYILPPTNFNTEHMLPNKFFEFIQARLAIVISPSKEMKKIVEEYNLGVISPDFTAESMAKVLNSLDQKKITAFKIQSDKAAQLLNEEENQQRLREMVKSLHVLG